MPNVTHNVIEAAAAWRGRELAAARDWIHEFSAEEITELHRKGGVASAP